MKTIYKIFALAAVTSSVAAHAASTINAVNRYAYAANLGWADWRGDGANGAVIGQYVCSGYIYSANVGWIYLGSGAPANAGGAARFGIRWDF